MLSRGAGVTIGQPDTGMADHHLLSDAMIVEPLFNLIERGKPPYDPLRHGSNGSSGSSPWHPGHGTAVASNAVSRGNDADKRMRGATPEAKALPIRCVESVLLTDFQASILAEAIGLAGARCQVVSMSLGGAGAVLSAVVHVAIKQAAERGVVFVAAAGNYTWRFPVYPALDYFCAAIAGSTWTDEGWYWSGGGSHVTVSAPADGVWTAWRAPKDGYATRKVGQSTGTSYAAAIVVGVAALWIAQHGHANLLRRYGEGWKVTKAFQLLLKRSARTPAGWNKGYYGEGIVDADALLRRRSPRRRGSLQRPGAHRGMGHPRPCRRSPRRPTPSVSPSSGGPAKDKDLARTFLRAFENDGRACASGRRSPPARPSAATCSPWPSTSTARSTLWQ